MSAFEKGFEKKAGVLGRLANPRVAANVAASAAASAKQEGKKMVQGATGKALQEAGENVAKKSTENVIHYDQRLFGYKAPVHNDGKYHP